MGIRGLTTYIQSHAEEYLEPHRLHDTYLVVDGNNVASQLYNWVSKCNCAFGGDYDTYSRTVSDFFNVLKKCNVSPLVLFDGGYEPRKLGTVRSRLRNRILTAKRVTPVSQSKLKCFPLLMKEVFKDVLLDVGVPFMQCNFEADSEIAALARTLSCPVLSYDSDFYIYGVLYIPLSSLSLQPQKDPDRVSYFINCKLYQIEKFLNHFGGLEKSMLPLMATLLGNDYIKRSTFSNFFSQIKMPKSKTMNETQKRISGLLHWLRKETVESAIFKVLQHLKKDIRYYVAEQIRLTISGYSHHPSEVISALGLSVKPITETQGIFYRNYVNCTSVDFHETAQYNGTEPQCKISVDYSDEESEDTKESESSDSTISDKELIYESCTQQQKIFLSFLPQWFKTAFAKGDIPPCLYDMLSQNIYFMSPQVEDYSLDFSQEISLPIVQTIFGLLDSNNDNNLVYYSRGAGCQLRKCLLKPTCRTARVTKFPILSALPELPLIQRIHILFDTVDINGKSEELLSKFPSEWKLYVITLKYWLNHVRQPVLNSCHIHALVFCAVILNIVDRIAGHHKTKKYLGKKRKLKNKSDSLVTVNAQSEKSLTEESSIFKSEDDSIIQAFNSLDQKECLSLAEAVLPLRQIDERMKTNHKMYSVTTVHSFAQFQSCLLHIRYLNALLNFPFFTIRPAEFYSGTLLYNSYSNFKKRSDVQEYVSVFLRSAPSVFNLYKLLMKNILDLLPDVPVLVRKKHKRRKIKHKETKSESPKNVGTESDEADFMDHNNRFHVLIAAKI